MHIDGNLLASTRQKAKLSINDVASACSLSAQQILSLETDSDAGFFNDQFKIICAKKYINLLKLNSANVISIPNKQLNVDQIDNSHDAESESKKSNNQFSFDKLYKTVGFKVLIPLAAITIILTMIYYFSSLEETEAVLDDPNLEPEISNDPNLEPEISNDLSLEVENNQLSLFESTDIASAESIDQEQDLVIPNNSDSEQLDEISCNSIFQSADIQNYRTPNVPDKPDTYVHIKSNLELPLCIKAYNSDAKFFTVTENDPLTFSGQAPFTMYISNPEGVQVFFQGWQVWLNPDYQVIRVDSYEDPNLRGLE